MPVSCAWRPTIIFSPFFVFFVFFVFCFVLFFWSFICHHYSFPVFKPGPVVLSFFTSLFCRVSRFIVVSRSVEISRSFVICRLARLPFHRRFSDISVILVVVSATESINFLTNPASDGWKSFSTPSHPPMPSHSRAVSRFCTDWRPNLSVF